MSEKTESNACQGCGAQREARLPQAISCGDCLERTCDDCGHQIEGVGQLVGSTVSCPCWTPIENVPVADLKAALAQDGIGLGLDGELTL